MRHYLTNISLFIAIIPILSGGLFDFPTLPSNSPVQPLSVLDDKTYRVGQENACSSLVQPITAQEKTELQKWIDELEKYESSIVKDKDNYKRIDVNGYYIPFELKKAFYCESLGKHRENGKVVIYSNENGTIDVGIAQLNEIHFPRMREMDLNPYIKKDNITFAKILYEEKGLQPWYAINDDLTCVWDN